MKSGKRVLLLLVCAYIIFFNFRCARFYANARKGKERSLMFAKKVIFAAGGEEQVLRSCRSILNEYSSINEVDYRHSSIKIREVTNLEAQVTLRKMNIDKMTISSNCLAFILRAPDPACRSFQLLAFRENSPEYGTIKLTNGLWYFNGNPSKETRKLYHEEEDRRMGRLKK